MLRPTAIKVRTTDDYQLIIDFDNQETRIYDIKRYSRSSHLCHCKINQYSILLLRMDQRRTGAMILIFALMICIMVAFRIPPT